MPSAPLSRVKLLLPGWPRSSLGLRKMGEGERPDFLSGQKHRPMEGVGRWSSDAALFTTAPVSFSMGAQGPPVDPAAAPS